MIAKQNFSPQICKASKMVPPRSHRSQILIACGATDRGAGGCVFTLTVVVMKSDVSMHADMFKIPKS